MSDVMLLGVLRMPMPDNPADMGGLEWAQVKDRMRQAADEIEKERAAVDGHIRLIEVLEDEVARLRAELAAERERAEAATHYATQITVWTVETFFEPDKTGWKPLTELLGVLSQLDNALVGVREKRDKLREALEPFANIGKDYPYVPTHEDYERARAVMAETRCDNE